MQALKPPRIALLVLTATPLFMGCGRSPSLDDSISTEPLESAVTGDRTPIGWVDGVSGNRVFGWACDQDTPNASIEVHLYFGGPAGSSSAVYSVGGVMANRASDSSINSACGGGSAHRFDWYMPASVRAQLGQQPYAVHAYGINTNPSGGNSTLSGSPRTIIPSSSVPSRTNAVGNASFEEGMDGWSAISGSGTSNIRWSESNWRASHESDNVFFALGGGPNSPAGLCAVEQRAAGVKVRPNTTYVLSASYLDPRRSSMPGYSGGATYYGGEWMRILVSNPANPGERYALAVRYQATAPGAVGPTSWTKRTISFATGSSLYGLSHYNGINGAPLGSLPKDVNGWNLDVAVGKNCGYLLGNSSGDDYHAQTWIDLAHFEWSTTPVSQLPASPTRSSGSYSVTERNFFDPNNAQTLLGNGQWDWAATFQTQPYAYLYAPTVIYEGGQYLLWDNVGWHGDTVAFKRNASLSAMYSQRWTVVFEGLINKSAPASATPGPQFDWWHTADPSVIKGSDGWYYVYYSGANESSFPIKGGMGVARIRPTSSTSWGWEYERLNLGRPIVNIDAGGYGTGQPAVALGANGYYYMVYTHSPYPSDDTRNVARVLRSTTPDFSQPEWVRDINLAGIGIVSDLAFNTETNEFILPANLSAGNFNLVRLHFYSSDFSTYNGYADFYDYGGVMLFGEQVALVTDPQKRLLARNANGTRTLTFAAATHGSRAPVHISGPGGYVTFVTSGPSF